MNRGAALLLALAVMVGVSIGAVALFSEADRGPSVLDRMGVKVIEGLGSTTQVTRQVGDFRGVRVNGGISLTVTNDKAPLVVELEENLVDSLKAEVRGGVLELGWHRPVASLKGVTASVGAQSLDMVDLSGGSQLAASSVEAKSLHIDLSGGSSLDLKGQGGKLTLDLSGGSKATLDLSGDLTVASDTSGASRLLLTGSGQTLKAHATGASQVQATGSFATVEVNASGASEIQADAVEVLKGEASGASRVISGTKPKEVRVESSGASTVRAL